MAKNKDKKDRRIKCVYCGKPIHIDNWAGVNIKGSFARVLLA